MRTPTSGCRRSCALASTTSTCAHPNYKPPDVWLGSQHYREYLDMWSFGCVSAEIYSRQILIAPAATAKQAQSPISFFEAIAVSRCCLCCCVPPWSPTVLVPTFQEGDLMEGGRRSCADGQPFPDRGEGCLYKRTVHITIALQCHEQRTTAR